MAEKKPRQLSRRGMLKGTGATVAALGLTATGLVNMQTAQAVAKDGAVRQKPTIVLVHGAWAESGSWAKVIRRLQEDDYSVIALPNSLRSLSSDSAAVRKAITDLNVPVLVVGHSYGGAVITAAASGLANVKGLVYIAGFAPNTGEDLLSLATQFDQQYGPVPGAQYYRPDGPFDADHPQTLIYLDRANFGSVFAQNIDRETAAILAATQRPIALACFGEPLGVEPAWKQCRTWYQVSAQDRLISPAGERWFAKRMGAETIELDTSHASLVAEPGAIARLIKKAAVAVAQ